MAMIQNRSSFRSQGNAKTSCTNLSWFSIKEELATDTPARQSRKLGNFEFRILNFELMKSATRLAAVINCQRVAVRAASVVVGVSIPSSDRSGSKASAVSCCGNERRPTPTYSKPSSAFVRDRKCFEGRNTVCASGREPGTYREHETGSIQS